MDWHLWLSIIGIVGVVIGIAVWILRKPLTRLLDRFHGWGREGPLLDPSQQRSTPPPDPRVEAEALLRQLEDPMVLEVENAVRQELDRKNLLGVEAVPVLIRYLARLSINNQFNEIYRQILGSQMRVLNHLNGATEPVERFTLERFYTEVATAHPQIFQNFVFETWLTYLRRQVLIIQNPDGRFSITIRGRSFLAYLVQNGASFDRLY